MQHQRLKREMLQAYRKEQGNFLARAKNEIFTKRASRKYRRMVRKRNFSVVTAFTGLALTAGLAAFLAILLGIMVSNIFTESMANTVSQNDYYDMTEATQYFREKKADLEESLLPENLEPVLLENHPGIYEFVYNIAEINFDANTLVAYLSAKYIEFTLDDIKAELNAIFDEYYTLSITIEEEEREVPDEAAEPDPITGERPTIRKPVPICYITLEKKISEYYWQKSWKKRSKSSRCRFIICLETGSRYTVRLWKKTCGIKLAVTTDGGCILQGRW